MTDLEMTRLCAEAMGYHIEGEGTRAIKVREHWPAFDPLFDDAQAMALVKKCDLRIWKDPYLHPEKWSVCRFMAKGDEIFSNADLNRAIVECVAKMQKAKVA